MPVRIVVVLAGELDGIGRADAGLVAQAPLDGLGQPLAGVHVAGDQFPLALVRLLGALPQQDLAVRIDDDGGYGEELLGVLVGHASMIAVSSPSESNSDTAPRLSITRLVGVQH